MGTLSSPLMIPGAANPSGTQISMPAPFSATPSPGSGGSPGINSLLPGGANPTSTNPYLPATSTGGFSAYGFPPGGGTGTTSTGGGSSGTVPSSTSIPGINVGNTGSLNPHQTNQLTHTLDKTFGTGVGQLIQNFLSSGAGYSPQVLQQLFAQLQPGFVNQQQNLLQQFSASGNRFGSGAETGYADLLGQQSMTEGNIAAQLYEQSVQNYLDVLMGSASGSANRRDISMQLPSTADQIMSGLGTAAVGTGSILTGIGNL